MSGGVTGTHVDGEPNTAEDANAQDAAIIALTASMGSKTTATEAATTAADLIAVQAEADANLYLPRPVVVPDVTGARDTTAALESALAALVSLGLINNLTTATGTPGTAPAWYSSVVPSGTVGVAYSFQYIATGTPTPTYTVTVGTLPTGLSLALDGWLTGDPTTAGSWTFTVTASNGSGPDITRERTISIAAVSAPVGAIYGSGIGFDTKANIPLTDVRKAAYKFVPSTTANLNAVRFTQRSGAPGDGYSAGTGGTMTVQVRPDDGAGHPHATTVLATLSFNPVNYNVSNTEVYDLKAFSSPPALTAGTPYWIVFTGSSSTNYISINMVYKATTSTPRQPLFADADFGVLESNGTWGALDANYTPLVDLVFSDGTVDGQGYYEAGTDFVATITGTSQMVRERFTVSGGSRTATGAYVRVERISGTSPLILTLDSVDPTTGATIATIDSISVPSSSIPIYTGTVYPQYAGAVWAGGAFAASRTLTNGATYALRISTAAGTTYTATGMRQGTSKGYNSYVFSDGIGEKTTTGTSWSRFYTYDIHNVQMYFTLA